MSRERYVVLGLAHVRSAWFRDVARWATSGTVGIEFVKCVSSEELRSIIDSGRPISAVLIDASLPALDRDLVDRARAAGASTIVVDDGRVSRRWAELGVRGVLSAGFTHAELAACLADNCVTVGAVDTVITGPVPDAWKGFLITVTGAGGVGTSTVAMAIAGGIAADARNRGVVALADLARRADQALLHDAGDVVPGVQELVEAHRVGAPPAHELRRLLFADVERGYSLLLGLRQPRDWTALRPRAFEAALDNLCRAYRIVVADTEADFEGEEQTGSLDVEERNLMSRTAAGAADLVVAVGVPGVTGLRSLVRAVDDLLRLGLPAERVLPVINRAPRNPRQRAELARALADLTGGQLARNPLFVGATRRLDRAARDGQPVAAAIARPLAAVALHALDQLGSRATAPHAEPVVPGSIGMSRARDTTGREMSA